MIATIIGKDLLNGGGPEILSKGIRFDYAHSTEVEYDSVIGNRNSIGVQNTLGREIESLTTFSSKTIKGAPISKRNVPSKQKSHEQFKPENIRNNSEAKSDNTEHHRYTGAVKASLGQTTLPDTSQSRELSKKRQMRSASALIKLREEHDKVIVTRRNIA